MATNMSNIVKKAELRKAQVDTLEKIASVVGETAGPAGSYVMILNDGLSNAFTKDGHKVLTNIKFFHPLEKSIIEEIVSSTGYVAKVVGDGTTAMTKLSYLVFKGLCMYETKHPEVPRHKIITALKHTITEIQKRISDNSRELTLEDIYKICMISTDGNEEVSEEIYNIYKEYGKDVFINLSISNTEDHVIKTSDGMTIQRGYPSPSYINTKRGTCELNAPRLYCFTDPVDTPEMINYFGKIINDNITEPLSRSRGNSAVCTPTVIMCPSISRDLGDQMASIESMMYGFKELENKPPLLIITGFTLDLDFYHDLIHLSGAPSIKKYIDPEIQKMAQEEGSAPTMENISEFYGECEQIVSDNNSTCFINPAYAIEKDEETGEIVHGKKYVELINFLEGELAHAQEENQPIPEINNIKRRLHSLQSNYIEYFIGGISNGDRNAVKDLAEDAILNCRSANSKGVGRGANFEGLIASMNYISDLAMVEDKDDNWSITLSMAKLIHAAFKESITSLYASVFGNNTASDVVESSILKNQPINLRTLEYNSDVLCSIETDIAILEAIARIETMMFNTTQSLLALPTENIYISDEDLKRK